MRGISPAGPEGGLIDIMQLLQCRYLQDNIDAAAIYIQRGTLNEARQGDISWGIGRVLSSRLNV